MLLHVALSQCLLAASLHLLQSRESGYRLVLCPKPPVSTLLRRSRGYERILICGKLQILSDGLHLLRESIPGGRAVCSTATRSYILPNGNRYPTSVSGSLPDYLRVNDRTIPDGWIHRLQKDTRTVRLPLPRYRGHLSRRMFQKCQALFCWLPSVHILPVSVRLRSIRFRVPILFHCLPSAHRRP